MTTYRFTGPSTTRKHKGTCPRCKKKVIRSRTFKHTVNPFNCVGEGDNRRPKTWAEVAADVQAEAEAWLPDFRCQSYEQEGHQRAGRERCTSLCTERIAAYEARVQELTRPTVAP